MATYDWQYNSQDPKVYVPQGTLAQYKGTDPNTNQLTYYYLDANKNIIRRLNTVTNAWESYKDFAPRAYPNDMTPSLSSSDVDQINNQLGSSGVFKDFTQYLTIGDEGDGNITIDITSQLSSDDLDGLKVLLVNFPRMFLKDWFDQNLGPQIIQKAGQVSSTYAQGTKDAVWRSFVDLFNQVNLKYVNDNSMSPWAWEDEKLKRYYISQNADQMKALQDTFQAYLDLNTYPDPKAQDLMNQYLALPKLGDPGLEISRQNAIKELLVQKEYDSVQGIIAAFRNAQYTVVGDAITKPIPFDINFPSGAVVKSTPLG